MTALMTEPTAAPSPWLPPPTATLVEGTFDAEAFAAELDALRAEIEASLGEDDAAYIRRLVTLQRRLELAGRAALWAGILPPAWLAGVGLLGLAKVLENMEIGHNVMHAQWDWMRDPEIHSTTWEWDNVCPTSQWRHTHNHVHHQWTNVEGRDHDIGYGILRVHASQPWTPVALIQPFVFVGLALAFQYGVGFHEVGYRLGRDATGSVGDAVRETLAKVGRQAGKDYLWFPLLAAPVFGLPGFVATASGNLAANLIRNLWSFSVIFCGHFPDGVETFSAAEADAESRGEWYRRQVLGSANFDGGGLVHLLSGNLDHQIEHHLFPDLPSNRYVQIAPRVKEICARHGVAYRTGSFVRQFGSVVRNVVRLALPGPLGRSARRPAQSSAVTPDTTAETDNSNRTT